MSLSDSRNSIGAVSDLLRSQLTANTTVSTVDVGRPEVAALSAGPKFNLFLYHVEIDGYLRNHSLDEGQQAPLWLVLHYLLTAFDEGRESDTIDAHNLLGEGMLALRELNYLKPTSAALADNPESLKVTFDSADSELLSKVMQGTDEKYRVSAAFQVRPIMIAPSKPPAYSPPVQTVGPPSNPGVAVFPSLGPRLDGISPDKFGVGDTIILTGKELGSVEEVQIGDTRAPVIGARSGQIKVLIPEDIDLSAGSHTITAIMQLDEDHSLNSNAVLGHLLPRLDAVTPGTLTDTAGMISGDLSLSGVRLGGVDDAVYVAFYADGKVALMLEAVGTAAQTTLAVTVSPDDAIPAGPYYILLRVNGEQAADIHPVDWS